MEAIGGYHEIELKTGKHYHKNAIRLNTARNCFEYILCAKKYKKVYIPYYTCEVMLEPLKKWDVAYEFYSINEKLEPHKNLKLKNDEAFLYTNYFGLKQDAVKQLAKAYSCQLIVDNSQAFFDMPIDGIDTFYSPRKFFGVSDGAYLYTDTLLDKKLEQDQSYDRMSHLLKRADVSAKFGYLDFKTNDDALINQPIKKMSKLTEKILCSIDYESIKTKRVYNYKILEQELSKNNLLKLEFNKESVPMVYPYLTNNGKQLKNKLINNKIYIATFWNNVLEWCNLKTERNLVNNLVTLPINVEQYQNIVYVLSLIQ